MRYWIDFKKLREELSFGKILEQYSVKLHVKGEQATGPCPLPGHSGDRKTDSFSANLPKGIFQCFSCGAKGNALDFAVLMAGRNPRSGQDTRQTGIELAKRYGLQNVGSEQKTREKRADGTTHTSANQRNTNHKKAEPPPEQKRPESAPVPIVNALLPFSLRDLDPKHPYLFDRGLTAETINTFGLGFCSNGRLAGRIAIPIHDLEGNLIAYAGRLVDEGKVNGENPKYLFPGTRIDKGQTYEFRKSLVVYNGNRVRKTNHLIIVEGFASVWWLTQNGFPNSVALMGSSLSHELTAIIRKIVGDNGSVTVLTDGDIPGMRCCDEIRAKLGDGITIHRPTLKIDAQPTDFTKEELEELIPVQDHNENRDVGLRQSSKEERICVLIREFPSLADLQIEPQDWNAEEFDKRSLKFSSGQKMAAQFVLRVWNPSAKWQCGRFDAVEAAAQLDPEHLKPISTWLQNPWWP